MFVCLFFYNFNPQFEVKTGKRNFKKRAKNNKKGKFCSFLGLFWGRGEQVAAGLEPAADEGCLTPPAGQ